MATALAVLGRYPVPHRIAKLMPRDSIPMVPQPSNQLDLFEMPPRARDHGGTAITDTGEGQVRTASIVTSALTQPLMEQLCRHENLRRAYKRVKANRGAPGVDGIPPASGPTDCSVFQERS